MRPARKQLRGVLLGLIALLYGVSIPWYRPTGAETEIVLGLPAWVSVALGAYVGVAILNALAWILTDVSDDSGGGSG